MQVMKVLFVDNEEDIASLVEIALETQDDIDLTVLKSGQEGIEAIRSHEFDIFVFDLMMPQPDGRALLEEVRSSETNGGKPVIMCTAKSDRGSNAELMAGGATRILHKPFDILAMADVLRAQVASG